MKNQPSEWEKIFATQAMDKGLIPPNTEAAHIAQYQKKKKQNTDLFLTFSTVNSPCYKSDNAIPLPNILQWLFISSTLESKWVVAYANLPILISNTPPTPTSIIRIMVTAGKDAVLARCQVFC